MTIPGSTVGNISGGLSGAPRPSVFSPFSWDSGGKPLRAIVQDAVVEMLSRLLVENGAYLRKIAATDVVLHGRGDTDGLNLLMDEAQGDFPSVWVSTGDQDFKPAGDIGSRWSGTLDVHVYFVVNSMRGRVPRQVGDVNSAADGTDDPGVYAMMQHVFELLAGKRPGDTNGTIKELRPKTEIKAIGDNEFEIWQQIYTVQLSHSIKEKRDLTSQVKQINASGRLADDPLKVPLATTETVIKP